MHLDAVPTSSHTRSEEEVALANLYADQHERLDNFIFMYAVPSSLLKRFRIDIFSRRGYTLLFGIFFCVIFIPGVLLTALTSQWDALPFSRLVLVAMLLALLNVIALIMAQTAAYKISALHRMLRNAEQIQMLILWDRKWFGPKMSALMGGLISLTLLFILYWLNLTVNGIRLPISILWICAVITVFLGQFSFSTMLVCFEFKRLAECRFELYRLSPYDTFQMQRTSVGLKQLGMVSTVSLPFFLLVLLIVLPPDSSLNIPITIGFLLMSYLATAVGILLPLGFLGDIVKAEKWRVLNPIQTELNRLTGSFHALTNDEHEHFTRLQGLYGTIRHTHDNFLSFGSVVRILGTLLLATFSVVLPAILERFL